MKNETSRMTVKELKAALDGCPEDSIVLVQGYEGGFSDIGLIKKIKVTLNFYKEEWNGPHEESNGEGRAGILILRAPNPNASP